MLALAWDIAAELRDSKQQYLLAAIGFHKNKLYVATNKCNRSYERMSKAHAEQRLLRKAPCRVIYVARATRSDTWAISKPCPECQKFINNKRSVEKVYYTIGPNEYGIWYKT